MKFLIGFIFICTTSTGWIKSAEKSIKSIDQTAQLDIEREEKDKNGLVIFKQFSTSKETKTTVNFQIPNLMDLEVNFYENEKIMFAEITKGLELLMYKRTRLKTEPYAVLMEDRIYFKNEDEGIKQSRKVDVYENSDIDKLKITLESLHFIVEKIGAEEYQNMKDQYRRLSQLND